MTLSSFRRVAAATLIVGAVTACSTSPPPTEPSTSNSSSPSPTTSTSSATATAPSPEAQAIRAVETYMAAYNDAIRSRRPAELKKTFAASCRLCNADAAMVEDLARTGQKLEGSQRTVSNLRVSNMESPKRISVSGTMVVSKAVLTDAAGKLIKTYPAGQPVHLIIQLESSKSIWRVKAIIT